MSYYLKKLWKANLIVIILQFCMHAIQASFALLMVQRVQAILDFDLYLFLFWEALHMAGWGMYLFLDYLVRIFRGRAVRKMNNMVRRDMAASLLKKDYQEFHAQDSGEYLSWFSAVIMIVMPKLFEKKLEYLSEKCAQGQAAATGGLKDLLRGYDVLRFFGRGVRFRKGIDKASEQIEEPAYQETCKAGMIYDGVGMVNILSQTIIYVYTVVLVIMRIIPYATLAGVGNPSSAISNGLDQLASCRMCFSASKPYFARITVYDDGSTPQKPQGTKPVQDCITVENVSFNYGEKPILKDMSATFRKGGKYALTGSSGCGKSTLLKLLLGWLPDYSGIIRFDGRDAKDFTTEELLQQMSYIAQDVVLFNTTIRDNITLGGDFTDGQMQKALKDSALAGDLANMPDGLDTAVGEEGSNLSGGQRQRVAIARALIHDRSIILVDEGTSALDEKNANIVEESLLANPELTLILVSHHLAPERKAQFDHVYQLKTCAA